MGKFIPVQMNREITGEVLIEISDKTIPRLVLPEIVNNVKKKLGCIFVENHNHESMMLKRGQTIGIVMSCIMLEEQGQASVERCYNRLSITGERNDTDT